MQPYLFRIRHLFAAGAAAACAACVSPVGTPLPSSASAPAPAVSPGDRWTYRVRDGFTGIGRGDQSYRVTDANVDRISVAVSGGGRLDETYVYNREWNWLKHPATNLQSFDYSPAYPATAFPLAPGKRWKARVTATDPADGRRFPVTIDGVALGWERVKVPAGEFEALKIRRVVFFGYWEQTVRDRSEIIEYEWYAPAVKQSVRREAESRYLSYLAGGVRDGFLRVEGGDRDGGGPRFVQDDWLIYELVSYSVR